MSSYDDKRRNTSLNLMAGRLGIFTPEVTPKPVEGDGIADEHALDGINHQSTLLKYNGGHAQHNRMVRDKRRSLDRALLYSYQAATVKKISSVTESEDGFVENSANKRKVRALINPNKLKMDYDDKIISIPWEEGFQPGTIFEWEGTGTKWLIYLQDLTELAYFRGDIRKCSFDIKWKDDEGNIHSTFAAIRGPVETKINYIQKSGISVDEPNHTLNILMPKTDETVAYFKRYAKFYIGRRPGEENDPAICWRVEGFDWISTPGILEITAVEYYSNKCEDDCVEGIVGGLIVQPVALNLDHVDILINGETFIKPHGFFEYKWMGPNTGANSWKVDSKYPITLEVDEDNSNICRVRWNSSYSGEFELVHGMTEKKIVVQSLF